VTAANVATGRNAFLDITSFPASDGGGTTDTDGDGVPDSLDNCPDVHNAGQRDDDNDGVGNKCEDGSTPPTDTDNDEVIGVYDQCPNDPGPASNNGCPITGESVSIVGAGDIAARGSADIATGDLIDARPDALVFTAGDNAYPKGSASDFTAKYEEAWGPFKARTMPSPGNHEYETPGASGYFGYFSAPPAAPVPNTIENPGLTPGKGYYSYNLGSWHILSLNSNIEMDIGSPQYNFAQIDLATNGALCELAYWHHPIASSGQHGNQANARPIFKLFDEKGGDLVLNGHEHNYEAFRKINYLGEESESGVRQIIVGTGGTGLRGEGFLQRGSEERNFDTHGIVDINLYSTGYFGQFVPVVGKTFTDSFEGMCET
jgi:acid phosphatase type 7